MNTSRRPIVVGVSDKETTAIRYGLSEARRLRTGLRLVHCYELPAQAAEFYIGTDLLTSMRISGEAVLDEARKLVENSPDRAGTQIDYVLAHGTPDNVLSELALEAGSLVLGADDIPWYDRMLGGAVAGYLARKVACPVIIVPQRSHAPRSVEPRSGGGVVVTIDGDTSASGPLRYGFEQCDARNETLTVLHAAPAATLQEDFDNHLANVAEVIAGWQELYPDVRVTRSTTSGDPLEICIASTARASLVVIGRPHGLSVPFAMARPVAMQVLREAQCPVAIVGADYRGI